MMSDQFEDDYDINSFIQRLDDDDATKLVPKEVENLGKLIEGQ